MRASGAAVIHPALPPPTMTILPRVQLLKMNVSLAHYLVKPKWSGR
jgi:hypothetical protein